MSVFWQQQVFALDVRYNSLRAKNHPNFRTLYIRRRNQLLRELGTPKCLVSSEDVNFWKQYLKIRSHLLQTKYGTSFEQTSLRRFSINPRISPENASVQLNEVDSITKEHELMNKTANIKSSIHENYAFKNIHHIFDQHTSAVTMVKFANTDRSRLCCISNDSTASICNVLSEPPKLEYLLKGHKRPVTGCDWSLANDLLVTCSLDGQICVWDTTDFKCVRSVRETPAVELLSCLFHPINNNVVVAGNAIGQVEVLNISTGKKIKHAIGGRVLSLAFESNGVNLWAGNDLGIITHLSFDQNSGKLSKKKKHNTGFNAAITSINWRAWTCREAHDPFLLVNISNNLVQLYRFKEKGLELKWSYNVKHYDPSNPVRSTFCPIMSFKQGVCIGSEDSCVYFLDVECNKNNKDVVINKLQGHSSPVFGISFNYDESLLSTSDQQGLVMIWTRARL